MRDYNVALRNLVQYQQAIKKYGEESNRRKDVFVEFDRRIE